MITPLYFTLLFPTQTILACDGSGDSSTGLAAAATCVVTGEGPQGDYTDYLQVNYS